MSPNFGPFPFPKELFLKFVRENNGYFPVRIQALPEGTCVNVHTPVYQVGAFTGQGGERSCPKCQVATPTKGMSLPVLTHTPCFQRPSLPACLCAVAAADRGSVTTSSTLCLQLELQYLWQCLTAAECSPLPWLHDLPCLMLPCLFATVKSRYRHR